MTNTKTTERLDLAFIPRNLLVETQNKRIRKIKYIYAREWRTPDKVFTEQYYESNQAVTRVIDMEEFHKIERLYEVFPDKKEIN